MTDDTASMFATIQESLQWLEEKLSDVMKDVKRTPQRMAQPFGDQNPGSVQST